MKGRKVKEKYKFSIDVFKIVNAIFSRDIRLLEAESSKVILLIPLNSKYLKLRNIISSSVFL